MHPAQKRQRQNFQQPRMFLSFGRSRRSSEELADRMDSVQPSACQSRTGFRSSRTHS